MNPRLFGYEPKLLPLHHSGIYTRLKNIIALPTMLTAQLGRIGLEPMIHNKYVVGCCKSLLLMVRMGEFESTVAGVKGPCPRPTRRHPHMAVLKGIEPSLLA